MDTQFHVKKLGPEILEEKIGTYDTEKFCKALKN